MPALPITVETANASAVAGELEARLREFNERHSGPQHRQGVVLTIRNEAGGLIAGLSGECFWNALYVDHLWVNEAHRRQRYGAALLERGEQIARDRSCDTSYLNTFDFQAPGFYLKQGYRIIGELRDVPRGCTRIWFSKSLYSQGKV